MNFFIEDPETIESLQDSTPMKIPTVNTQIGINIEGMDLKMYKFEKFWETELKTLSESYMGLDLELDMDDDLFDINNDIFGFSESTDYKKSGHKIIPTNYQEAYQNINLINFDKAGKNNNYYKTHELKAIAKSLGIPIHGKKPDIVSTIRKHVYQFYNIPDPLLSEKKKKKVT